MATKTARAGERGENPLIWLSYLQRFTCVFWFPFVCCLVSMFRGIGWEELFVWEFVDTFLYKASRRFMWFWLWFCSFFFLSLSQCVRLSDCLLVLYVCLCLPVYLYICLSVFLTLSDWLPASVSLSVCFCLSISVWTSVYLSMSVWLSVSVCLFNCLCVSVCFSLSVSVWPSIYLSMSIWLSLAVCLIVSVCVPLSVCSDHEQRSISI